MKLYITAFLALKLMYAKIKDFTLIKINPYNTKYRYYGKGRGRDD